MTVLSDNSGFSLIELLISTTLVLIIFSGVTGFVIVVNRQFVTQRTRIIAVNNGEAAADTIARLIRLSGSRPSNCAGSFVVPDITPSDAISSSGSWYSKVRIRSDWNPSDCSLSGVEEDVTVSAGASYLFLDAGQNTPFVGNIGDIRFQFYDRGGTLMTSPETSASNIALVRISITTIARDGTSTVLTNSVSIRK